MQRESREGAGIVIELIGVIAIEFDLFSGEGRHVVVIGRTHIAIGHLGRRDIETF